MEPCIDDLVRDDAVHRSAYVDPTIFALEMERIFERTWVYVGHESELPEPGDFKTTTIGLNPVIVARAPDGEIGVYYNRCAHRGVTLCQTAAGNAAFFRCAYHGWTVARVASYRGFIFACIDERVDDLPTWLAGAAPYLDAFADSSPTGKLDTSAGVHRYFYNGNWKLQVDGSVDGYHPYILHKSFFDLQNQRSGKRSDMYSSETTTAFVAALGNGHAVTDSRAEFLKSNVFFERVRMSPGGPELIAELEQQFGADGARELLSRTGGTGFNLMVFPNLVLIQAQIRVIQPLAHNRTNVEIRPTTLGGVPDRVNHLRLRSHELFFGPAGFGSPDDLEAFNRTQVGLQARHVEWLDFSRGRSRERLERAGIVGEITDETHQRGIYREWRRLMNAAGVPEAVAP